MLNYLDCVFGFFFPSSVSVTQKPASARPISNNDSFKSARIEVVITDRNGNNREKKVC